MYNTGKVLGATTTAGLATGIATQLPQTSGNILGTVAVLVLVFLAIWAVTYLALEKLFNKKK